MVQEIRLGVHITLALNNLAEVKGTPDIGLEFEKTHQIWVLTYTIVTVKNCEESEILSYL